MCKKKPAREIIPGLPHHVILRGNNRRRIFSYVSEYNRFLYYLGRALAVVSDCALHALCLMCNHVHLIATPHVDGALPELIKRVSQRYAQYRNRRRKASGKLFEQRFYRRPIRSDRYLGVATAYVELNPVRAGIVCDPADYRWSTFRLHAATERASGVSSRIWTPSDWYLGLHADPQHRAQRYQGWVDASRARDDRIDDEEVIRRIELLSVQARGRGYGLRLERPDRSRAGERPASYGQTGAGE